MDLTFSQSVNAIVKLFWNSLQTVLVKAWAMMTIPIFGIPVWVWEVSLIAFVLVFELVIKKVINS